MTREDAIKMLEYLATDTTGTLAGYQGDYAEFLVRVIDALDMGIAALREQEKLESKLRVFESSGWISVTDRLPEPGQMVLVYCRSRMCTEHVTVSTYMKDYSHTRCCYWSRRVRDVTHWMPLPTPPEKYQHER